MRLLIALALPLIGPLAMAQEATGDAEQGKELFLGYACYSCHGYHGTGMTPLSKETSGILSREDVFLTYLRLRGELNPMNPSRNMPHYAEEVMSDDQARDIYAYLVSLNDDPPALEEIPAFVDILDDAERRTDGDSDPE